MALEEEILSLKEFTELHSQFNHECAKIINKIEEQKKLIIVLTKENEKLKKFKQNDKEVAIWKEKAEKWDQAQALFGGAKSE